MWPNSSTVKAAESAGNASGRARAKLTREIVLTAQKAHLDDPQANSVAKLAAKYGVTRMTMHRALERGYQWGSRAPNRKEFCELAARGMSEYDLVYHFEGHNVRFVQVKQLLEDWLTPKQRMQRFANIAAELIEQKIDTIDDRADEPSYRLD